MNLAKLLYVDLSNDKGVARPGTFGRGLRPVVSARRRIPNPKRLRFPHCCPLRARRGDRLKAIARFNTDPDLRGLLLSYKVGGDGLNLTAATHCICLEPWWNTAVTQQAQARIYRVGQTRPVVMHTLRAADTIESRRIQEICDHKAELTTKYLGAEMIRQIVVGR